MSGNKKKEIVRAKRRGVRASFVIQQEKITETKVTKSTTAAMIKKLRNSNNDICSLKFFTGLDRMVEYHNSLNKSLIKLKYHKKRVIDALAVLFSSIIDKKSGAFQQSTNSSSSSSGATSPTIKDRVRNISIATECHPTICRELSLDKIDINKDTSNHTDKSPTSTANTSLTNQAILNTNVNTSGPTAPIPSASIGGGLDKASLLMNTKQLGSNTDFQSKIILPNWASIFYQNMYLTGKIFDKKTIEKYNDLINFFISCIGKKQKLFTFLIIAKSFISFTNSHQYNVDNSLLGFVVHNKLSGVRVDLLYSLYHCYVSISTFCPDITACFSPSRPALPNSKESESFGLLSPSTSANSVEEDENFLRNILFQLACDNQMNGDDYRTKLMDICNLLQFQQQVNALWKGIDLKFGDLVIILDYHSASSFQFDDLSTKRNLNTANNPIVSPKLGPRHPHPQGNQLPHTNSLSSLPLSALPPYSAPLKKSKVKRSPRTTTGPGGLSASTSTPVPSIQVNSYSHSSPRSNPPSSTSSTSASAASIPSTKPLPLNKLSQSVTDMHSLEKKTSRSIEATSTLPKSAECNKIKEKEIEKQKNKQLKSQSTSSS